ncbi:MAG: methylated-DNA--[protein]-cysteine S-methyltransferase [Firmicutes bacterium]|nr:methylated-DNA--[protein]-cysteine S-methyltransferase [Bacillota bacterium]
MQYSSDYQSPLGKIWLFAGEDALTGLCFAESPGRQKIPENAIKKDIPLFSAVKHWLDIYFQQKEPDFMPPLSLCGSPFQLSVWQLLQSIPYGQTVTYGEIAASLASSQGRPRMSAQAVGGAVGRNPISILIPCHRVVGANGNLTGYGGGIDRKCQLLRGEGIDMARFFLPGSNKRPG